MDDLTRPLGQTSVRERPRHSANRLLGLFAGALCLPLAAFAGWVLFAGDRLGGEPMALAQVKPAIEASGTKTQMPVVKVVSSGDPTGTQQTTAPAGHNTVTIIDGISGRRQEVIVPNSEQPPKPK
jgi:hypothetical protein